MIDKNNRILMLEVCNFSLASKISSLFISKNLCNKISIFENVEVITKHLKSYKTSTVSRIEIFTKEPMLNIIVSECKKFKYISVLYTL